MNDSDDGLNYPQYKALCCLVAGGTLQDAAYEAGVSLPTIKRWKASPDFKRKLRDSLVKVYEAGLAETLLGFSEAAKELRSIITNSETSDRVKVSAITALFAQASNAKQLIIDERVTTLEAALNGD